MHSGYEPTNKWYSDFWYGIVVVFEAAYDALRDFVNVKAWDWETIGYIVGGCVIVATIIAPICFLLHWILP